MIRRALSSLLIRLAQRLDPMLGAARQQSMSGGVEGHADEARGAQAHALADDLDSQPVSSPARSSNNEFVDALKREAREQHGPKPTAYTRRLRTLR
jgi:hypothetical protein